ncbi:MAG TPA: hypothetical protein PK514_00750 [Spirochaetota bacterium]|nr:hypothetical protein [Spirochaetota bacterium]
MTRFRLIIIAALFLFSSCGSAEKNYQRLLEKYAGGETSDTEELYESLLDAYSISSHSSDKIFFTKNLVLLSGGDEPEVIYPSSITLSADESIDENITFAGINSDYVILGNNKGFCVFNDDGDPVAIYKSGPKETIDAMAMRNENVIFLSKGKLFEFNISSRQTREFVSGDFSSASKKFFRAFIQSSPKYSALITGIAGSYYISVYDTQNGGLRLKNVDSSAFDFSISGNNLYYLRGGAGNWTVAKYDISSKNRTQIRQVAYLENFVISESGFIIVAEGKSRIENFSGEKSLLPEGWSVKGSCGSMLLIEYDDRIYLIDFNVLMQRLKEISSAVKHASFQRTLAHG